MAYYKKKPVVIEAIQWTGKNLEEIISFSGLHESVANMRGSDYERLVEQNGLKIFTLEGPLHASVGDYIIRGVKGEFYPCKPDIFSATYDFETADSHGS